MSTTQVSRTSSHQRGFQRWVKLPMDDLPLIRPPKHHMLAHVTGGLTNLFVIVTKHKEEVGITETEVISETMQIEEKTKVDNETQPPEVNGDSVEENKVRSDQIDTDTQIHNSQIPKTDIETDVCDDQGKKEEIKTDNVDKLEDIPKEQNHENIEKDNSISNIVGETVNEKKDEGGGGDKAKKKLSSETDEDDLDEDDEATPYTDDEGEFVPEPDMPLLAGRYKYTQVLARGQSALIIKVLDTFFKNRFLAIKVLHRVYKPIGSQEADILLELHRADPWLHVPFARLQNQFIYGPHYCLVFEYLSPTPLYTHYDQQDIREVSALPHIRDLTVKLLTVLGFLYKQNVIHADLKPENILLRTEEDLASVMVVDFGNALRNTDEELSLYYSDFELQTLLYRAPEVIFGMKFSLEVDMWSLGCLLAECYLGEPLFMGKTKKEILNKITSLLGSFPREFSEGECAEEFAEFIGRPMSRYQRVENLRKRLSSCKDSTFLLLIERLLTYLPDRRFTPFEAACHPFVACSTPFLYLTPSPGYIRYPTIQLDMSTYPYLPGLPDDEEEDSLFSIGRRRLISLGRSHRQPGQIQKNQDGKQPDDKALEGPQQDSKLHDGKLPESKVTEGKQVEKKNTDGKLQDRKQQLQQQDGQGKTATRSDVKETLKSMGLRCEDFTISVYSREQAHAILRRQGVEVTANNTQFKDKLVSGGGKGNLKNSRASSVRTHSSPSKSSSNPNSLNNTRDSDEDDDDCVILDPPTSHKQVPKLPQQFQLMGTTVQVNRGAKRQGRPIQGQPQAKRLNNTNSRAMNYYRNDTHEDRSSGETSVQATLNRLKNYNISITCRRNASGMLNPDGETESDMDDESHIDSDDDGEDMTKYLSCEIGVLEEDEEVAEAQKIFDEPDIPEDDDRDEDYSPKKRKSRSRSKGKGKSKSSRGVHNSTLNLDSSIEELIHIPMEGEDANNAFGSVNSLSESEEKDPMTDPLSDPLGEGDVENDAAMVGDRLDAENNSLENERPDDKNITEEESKGEEIQENNIKEKVIIHDRDKKQDESESEMELLDNKSEGSEKMISTEDNINRNKDERQKLSPSLDKDEQGEYPEDLSGSQGNQSDHAELPENQEGNQSGIDEDLNDVIKELENHSKAAQEAHNEDEEEIDEELENELLEGKDLRNAEPLEMEKCT